MTGNHHIRLFEGQQRQSIVNKLMDHMRDWRTTPFEHEAAVRYALRSTLCLRGTPWRTADQEAASIVAECLRGMGARRPTHEEAQRYYVEPRENCSWCCVPLPPDRLKWRFCSEHCARSAWVLREYEDGWKKSELGRRAYEVIERSRTPMSTCKKCGTGFHPRREAAHQEFCSQKCFGEYRAYLPNQICQHCEKPYRQRQAKHSGRFCSLECYNANRREGVIDRTCEWCSKTFLAKTVNARLCSDHCRASSANIRSGKWVPKRLIPPVFDYIVRTLREAALNQVRNT